MAVGRALSADLGICTMQWVIGMRCCHEIKFLLRRLGLSNPHPAPPASSVTGKTMEQIILGATMQHIQENQDIRPSQHGFVKGRPAWPTWSPFFDQITCLVDEGKALFIVSLDFSKVFSMVSHSMFLEELVAYCSSLVYTPSGWLGPDSGGEWSYIHLRAGHKWCFPRLSIWASPL